MYLSADFIVYMINVVGFPPKGVFNAHTAVTVMYLGGDTNVFERCDSLNIRRGLCVYECFANLALAREFDICVFYLDY